MTREEIIEGLTSMATILEGHIAAARACDMSPTVQFFTEQLNLIREALALIQNDAPRLLTAEDFTDNPDADGEGYLLCWCEVSEDERKRGIELGFPQDTEFDGWTTTGRRELPGGDLYNPGVRYWTARPTDEQRKATSWPKEGET